MELKLEIKKQGAIFEGKAPEIMQKELDAAMESTLMLLQREVKERTPVGVLGAEGGLLGSIQTDIKGKGTPVVKGIVASVSEYAEAVEKGTKPHFPPTGPIQLWVKRKLKIEDEKQSRQVAFMIARSIAKRGTKGQYMFKKALEAKENKIQKIFEKAGYQIVRELNE
jgi:hypothetical protein